MQYLSRSNRTFKTRYKKHQQYLSNKSENKITIEENKTQSIDFKTNSEIPFSVKEIQEEIPIKLNRKGKKQKTTKLKKKKTAYINPVEEEPKENFLITQFEAIKLMEEQVKKMPFLRLFEERRFLKGKILEAIEIVKMEKKWIAA